VWLANPEFLAVANDAFLEHAILSGRPGTHMEAYQAKLGADGAADVVAYLRSQARPIESQHLAPPTGHETLFVNPNGRPPRDLAIRDGRFATVDEIHRALIDKRKLVIIDARPESDWRTSHIAGAVSIPHYQLGRLGEIPKNAWVVAYCACPHHLSGIVVDSLRARGYPHAFVLDEGILEWERRGYPIVAAPGTPLPPQEIPSSGATR